MSSFGLDLDLLGRNRSFAEEFEDELSKCDASIYSNYTTTAATAVDNDSESLTNDNTVTEHVRRYQAVLPTREFSECSTAGRSTEAGPATPRFNHLHENESVRTTSFEVAVDRLGVTPTPSSLDLLNDINEQDPAFLRALNAMRGSDLRVGEEAGRLSIAPQNSSISVENAKSCVTINVRTNTSTTTSTNKKFLSFVSKLPRLRGRTAWVDDHVAMAWADNVVLTFLKWKATDFICVSTLFCTDECIFNVLCGGSDQQWNSQG
jgi:hypothetical protein